MCTHFLLSFCTMCTAQAQYILTHTHIFCVYLCMRACVVRVFVSIHSYELPLLLQSSIWWNTQKMPYHKSSCATFSPNNNTMENHFVQWFLFSYHPFPALPFPSLPLSSILPFQPLFGFFFHSHEPSLHYYSQSLLSFCNCVCVCVPLLLLNTRKIYTFLWIESIVYRSNSNAMSSINVYVWLFLWFFSVPLSGRNRVSMLFRKKAKTCKLKFTVTEQKPFLPSNIGAEDTELVFVVFHG